MERSDWRRAWEYLFVPMERLDEQESIGCLHLCMSRRTQARWICWLCRFEPNICRGWVQEFVAVAQKETGLNPALLSTESQIDLGNMLMDADRFSLILLDYWCALFDWGTIEVHRFPIINGIGNTLQRTSVNKKRHLKRWSRHRLAPHAHILWNQSSLLPCIELSIHKWLFLGFEWIKTR